MANFREKIALRMLVKYKQITKPERLQSLGNAREIGIVYDVKNTEILSLNAIVHYFESLGKNVMSLGFYNEKESNNLVSDAKTLYFNQKDLDFWKIPKQELVSVFTNQEFDFLLNLDTVGSIPLQAISTFSKARTRMGKHFDQYNFAHDFMVKSDVTSTDDLFASIQKYLK